MASNAITTPSVRLNGNYIPIVPNSLGYKRGAGTYTVEAQSLGPTVETVYKKDQTAAVGHVTFVVEPIQAIIEQVRTAQNNNPNNRLQFVQNGFTRTMPTSAITNDPDLNLGADKNITIEMMGDPVN